MAAFRYTGNSDLPQVILKHSFTREGWTEVPDEIAERLSRHSHLEQKKERAAKSEDASDKLDIVKARGAKAQGDGKDRSVPPAYRGKPEEAAWLAGFDAEAD
jgi:hypothetical protein